jgi:hypothetical protein
MSESPRRQIPLARLTTVRRDVNLRSGWVVAVTRAAFVVGVALGLFPLGVEVFSFFRQAFAGTIAAPAWDEVLQAGLVGFLLGPSLSWVLLMPIAGRMAAGVEAVVLPVYRAFAWSPERYQEIYGKPLPQSSSLPQPGAVPRTPPRGEPR